MSRKLVLLQCLFVLLFYLMNMGLNPVDFGVKASNGYPVHNVTSGQNYTTIQEAINDAGYGDVIEVDAGTFNEDVEVNQTVSLIGKNRVNTVVNASGDGPAFYIWRDDVKITNFTIQNSSPFFWGGVYFSSYDSGGNVSYNTIRNCTHGVWLYDWTENNYVADNEIVNCRIGVKDWYSSGNFFIRNNISACSEYAISVEGSDDCVIRGNTISDCWGGVYLSFGSRRTEISDNDVSYCDGGIGLDASSSNNITNNRVTHCEVSGIYLGEALYTGSDDNFVINNTISYSTQGDGLFIYNSEGNNLSGNTVTNCLYNFGVEGEDLPNFINFIDTSNTVDGRPIYYWISEQDQAVPLDAGYVGLVNSTRITVENLNLTSNRQGILLAFTRNSTISGNSFGRNYYGVHVWNSSDENTIHGNNVELNEYGVWLGYSSHNLFYSNNFTGNTLQAHIESYGYTNSWNTTYPTGGNIWSDFTTLYPGVGDIFGGPYQNETWSDGIWDGPYEIDEHNVDHYPIVPEFPALMILPLFISASLLALVSRRRKDR